MNVDLEWKVTQKDRGRFEDLDENQTVERIGMLDDYVQRVEVMV